MPPPPGKLMYILRTTTPLRKKSGSSHDSMAFYRDKGTGGGRGHDEQRGTLSLFEILKHDQ